METAILFKTALLEIDGQPLAKISEDDIYNIIQKEIPEDNKELLFEEKAELIAFRYPAISLSGLPSTIVITAEMINYWKYRSENSQHPVLIARYSGLVHYLSKDITGEKADYTASKRYIDSLLTIIEQDLYKIPVYAKEKAKRALETALSMNDGSSINRSKIAIIALEDRIAINDKPGLWGFSYDLLLEGSKKILSLSEESYIIQTLEKRLSELVETDELAAEYAAERLARYYFKNNKKDDVKRVLKNLEAVYEKIMQDVAVIQQVNWIEKLYQLNKKFHLTDEAEGLLKRLRQLSMDTDKEMKKISSTIDIPKEKIDKYVEQILAGNNTEHIFFRIVEANTPKIKEAEEELQSISKIAPFQFLLSRSLQDKDGRKVATIGSLLEDPEGHLIMQFSNTIRIGTIFLHFIFEEGIKREFISTYAIIKFLNKSCIIAKDRLSIMERGLVAYLNQDYITAIHLLIPQFEEAMRNLVEMNGGTVLIEKDGTYNLKTFDHILKDEIIKDVFGEDMTLYFKVLFTDKRGWNLRNNVAHGLLDTSHFNKQNADRLIHAVLCLGMVRLNAN